MRHLLAAAGSVAVLVVSSLAFAQSEDVDACVEGLNEHERIIYDAVLPLFPVEGDPEDAVRDRVRQLVRDNELSRRQARDSADGAMECVRLHGEAMNGAE